MNSCRQYFEPSEEPIAFKLKKISERYLRDMNNRLKKDDLTYSQVAVLTFLEHRREEKTSLKDVCEALHIAHPTGIGLIRRLSEKGFVESRVDPDNRRFRIITLTETARRMLHDSFRHRQRLDQRLTEGLSREETETVKRLLDRMYDNIKDETEEEET
ncbi:MAG: winged helix-turn-helix transcriptional regulator [Lachnospiraceae bacterium]|jgi:MarR family multiple gene transcriptional regulator MgrA|nr:winged helix-turn-helix transcriptional regulator [Lachnospiraceae bacterium]